MVTEATRCNKVEARVAAQHCSSLEPSLRCIKKEVDVRHEQSQLDLFRIAVPLSLGDFPRRFGWPSSKTKPPNPPMFLSPFDIDDR